MARGMKTRMTRFQSWRIDFERRFRRFCHVKIGSGVHGDVYAWRFPLSIRAFRSWWFAGNRYQ